MDTTTPIRCVQRDDMKATLSLTTTFLIVAFAMIILAFFTIEIIERVTLSVEVVVENMEFLNVVDVTHILGSCLMVNDHEITSSEINGFTISGCKERFPGLDVTGYEYMIEDKSDSSFVKRSAGFSSVPTETSHSIFINILMDDGDIHVGRLHVQEK